MECPAEIEISIVVFQESHRDEMKQLLITLVQNVCHETQAKHRTQRLTLPRLIYTKEQDIGAFRNLEGCYKRQKRCGVPYRKGNKQCDFRSTLERAIAKR